MHRLVFRDGKDGGDIGHRGLRDGISQHLADRLRGAPVAKPQSDHQPAHLLTLHCTTGIAARQPVRPPTAPARSTESRSRLPPWRACQPIRMASVSKVTAFTTSRPPGGKACQTASSTPSRPAPPPMNTTYG